MEYQLIPNFKIVLGKPGGFMPYEAIARPLQLNAKIERIANDNCSATTLPSTATPSPVEQLHPMPSHQNAYRRRANKGFVPLISSKRRNSSSSKWASRTAPRTPPTWTSKEFLPRRPWAPPQRFPREGRSTAGGTEAFCTVDHFACFDRGNSGQVTLRY